MNANIPILVWFYSHPVLSNTATYFNIVEQNVTITYWQMTYFCQSRFRVGTNHEDYNAEFTQ